MTRLFQIALLIIFALNFNVLCAPRGQAQEAGTTFKWDGLYLGASFGAGLAQPVDETIRAGPGLIPGIQDLNLPARRRAGVLAGAQVGYNWQYEHFVWGFETDFGLLDASGGPNGVFSGSVGPSSRLPWFVIASHPNAKYFASIRGRAGYAIGQMLFYLTGGVASGGTRGPADLSLPGIASPQTDENLNALFTSQYAFSSRMKFAIGGGLEYAFADNWSARAEYLFLNRASGKQVFDNGAGFGYTTNIRNETNVLRFGLNYHFDAKNEIDDPADHSGNHHDKAELYSVHGQSINVVQAYPKFRAAYSGENSFPPGGKGNVGSTTNAFLGMRLWEGGAAYFNPEIDWGYGLNNSVGAANYVNAAVAKVGASAPYMRFQRYFLRQIVGLGGDRGFDPDQGGRNEVLESTQNQISGKVDKDRLIITLGKFAVGDVFDDNIYAHDPTTGFMNFAFNTMGAFDYAADSWGYTYGLATEWKQNWWTLRAGVFQLSQVPNGEVIEPILFRQYMAVTELEARYEVLGRPGAIKFLLFGDNGILSKSQDSIDYAFLTGDFPPRVDSIRRRGMKTGGGINVKQEISENIGFFLRASMADGRYEIVDYTDIDRCLAFGWVGHGALWDRELDEIGAGLAFSGLYGAKADFFKYGGLSVYIGDGALSYGGEKNLEAYYKLGLSKNFDLTFDYQLLVNPAHNLARGPINIFGLRLRAAF